MKIVTAEQAAELNSGRVGSDWAGLFGTGRLWSGLVWVGQCDNEICSRQRNGFLTLTGRVDVLRRKGPRAERGGAGQEEELLLMAFAVNVCERSHVAR